MCWLEKAESVPGETQCGLDAGFEGALSYVFGEHRTVNHREEADERDRLDFWGHLFLGWTRTQLCAISRWVAKHEESRSGRIGRLDPIRSFTLWLMRLSECLPRDRRDCVALQSCFISAIVTLFLIIAIMYESNEGEWGFTDGCNWRCCFEKNLIFFLVCSIDSFTGLSFAVCTFIVCILVRFFGTLLRQSLLVLISFDYFECFWIPEHHYHRFHVHQGISRYFSRDLWKLSYDLFLVVFSILFVSSVSS